MNRLVLFLLVVGVAFRLSVVPSARFTGDESDYWYKSRQVATGAYRPVYGPEITGSAARLPGPAYYYLMALPQALGGSPYFGSIFVALLHGLTAWLLFRLAESARGRRAGWVALALVAFAPWDVLYGDRIWGSCVVPVWGCLALYAAARSRERPSWLGVLVFLALVLPQLHLSVPVLWGACAVIVVLRPPPRWPWRALAVGAGLTVVAYLPPLIAELNSGFANSQRILAHGGGAAPWSEALWSPVKVFGYALLYGSSEIGYHWARGYWGGGFSEAHAYFTTSGLSEWWLRHGPMLSMGHLISVALAAFGWMVGLGRAARGLLRRFRRNEALDFETVVTIGLVVGLAVGAALLIAARKTYFPHYANILMPVLLFPVVIGIDAGFDRPRLRWGLGAALAVSMAAMAIGTHRYYAQIDGLNGLRASLSMVERVLAEPGPAKVRFAHFHNAYAWSRLAEGAYGRSLPAAAGSVVFTVYNQRAHRGPLPPGGTLHGPVLLQRRPPEGQPAPPVNVDYKTIRVVAEHPDGRRFECRPRGAQCSYGPKAWQKFEPTTLTIAGRPRAMLFMHPVQGGTVQARIPVPAGRSRGTVEFALSDAATRSTNRSPVEVVLRTPGGRRLAEGAADNHPGLKKLAFTSTATPILLEITTDNDGARVFGFDIRWTDDS